MNLSRDQRGFLFKINFALIFLFVSVFLLWKLQALIVPTLVGAFLAYIFKPVLNSFRYHWMPEPLRISILTLLFLSFILGTTWIVRENIPTESERLELLTRIQFKLNQKVDSFLSFNDLEGDKSFLGQIVLNEFFPLIENIQNYLKFSDSQKEKFIDFYKKKQINEKYYQYFLVNIQHNLEFKTSRDIASENEVIESFSFSKLMDLFSIWIVMPLVFLFLLFDTGEIRKYTMQFVPNRYLELTHTIVEEVDAAIGRYLRGTLIESLLVAATMFVGFVLIGMPLEAAFIISIFSGLTNAIPYLGPAVGLVVAGAYALIIENIDPVIPYLEPDFFLIGIITTIAITQFLDNFVYQPIILAQAVSLHALVVVFALIGGSTLFGFAGMVFAIPAVVILKVSIETLFRELKAYKII